MSAAVKGSSSPYATGGGGISLERSYGATVLAAILVGDPIAGMGDSMRVVRVKLQSGPDSPVDDFVIFGEDPATGVMRRLSVGVRRDPTITASDEKFVKLLGDYLRIVSGNSADVDEDRWRLALAVSGPHTGASETRILADYARAHATAESFRETVGGDGVVAASVRKRLEYLDEAVVAATREIGLAKSEGDPLVLTWRFLRALRVLLLRLEGDDATDRTHTVSRLRAVAGEPIDPEQLFQGLIDLLARATPRAALLDEATLRRELRGIAHVLPSNAHVRAWTVLATCEEQLRARTSSTLADATSGQHVSLARESELLPLLDKVRAVGEGAASLLVTGQPDVGKSALTLGVVDRLRGEGAYVIALSLRDLPRTTLEFEALLGARVATILGRSGVARSRLLVVDGAEAVLQGKADLLAHLARGAAHAGLGVVAVAREDAQSGVLDALSLTPATKPSVATIGAFHEDEVTQVLQGFPVLARIGRDPRSRLLLTKPGLIEILLRGGAHAALPDGALSEADVFAVVWAQHVRRNEVVVFGEATPDGREAALLALARKQFDSAPSPLVADSMALSSLRSDRLLLPVGPDAAWKQGDDFANDVIRDFTTARLLIAAPGENLLEKADAPRWSLRAARLACQVAFIQSGTNTEPARLAMQYRFEALARDHGERWADIPWEAALTIGGARSVIRSAAPWLLKDQGFGLGRLLRIVKRRCVANNLVADVGLVEPVVELVCDEWVRVGHLLHAVTDADDVVAAWLAGLAVRGKSDASHPLRCRIRERMLDGPLGRGDEYRLRCLGLLGPDLDQRSEQALRDLAKSDPDVLHACLEQSLAPFALHTHRPNLLLALTEAYYIERPQSKDGLLRHSSFHDDGIRGHQGAGSRLASPHYGPFWWLLRGPFREAITLINRILNHAARYRVAPEFSDPTSMPIEQLAGVDVDLPGIGRRRFIGDDHVWRWYRGSGVGPYPCVSALVALERFLDELVATGVPIATPVPILLQECENLAMAGLIVGTLVRHALPGCLDLDPWLQHPDIWEFEFVRTTCEFSQFHVHGPDPKDLPGGDRRRWSLREVSGYLVASALVANEQARLASLAAVGDALNLHAAKTADLVRTQRGDPSGDSSIERDAAAFLLQVRGWAAHLQHVHFSIERAGDGRIAVRHVEPPDIAAGFMEQRQEHARGQESWRLWHLYTAGDPSTWSLSLVSDIALARGLEAVPPNAGPSHALETPIAVAAGAIKLAAEGFHLSPEDLTWAADIILKAAEADAISDFSDDAIVPWKTDRAAARALPLLLALGEDVIDEKRLERGLNAVRSLSASSSNEVGRALSTALNTLWLMPCAKVHGVCLHRSVLQVFHDASRAVRMAPFNRSGKRPVLPLEGDVETELKALPAKDVLLSRLVAPIVISTKCTASECCAATDARALRDALFDAHRRASSHYAEKNHHQNDEDSQLVAAALLEAGAEQIVLHVRSCAQQAGALDGLLLHLSAAATSDPNLRTRFRAVWPAVMDAALETLANGCDFRSHRTWGPRAIAGLIPKPVLTGREQDVERALLEAAVGWPTADELSERIEGWLLWAAGLPEAVDALARFLCTAPMHLQASRLSWVARMFSTGFGAIANRTRFLLPWLEELRKSGALSTSGLRECQWLIDGLAAAGDSGALRLQVALEQ